MSKAVLVMDMPKSCDECPFSQIYESPDGLVECENPLSEEYGCDVSDYEMKRPKGCPLRELPEKAYHEYYCDNGRYDRGWNECLNAITGEKED